jgi:hypothetical protein
VTTGPSTLPYELRIGVTGHRTLADPAAVGRSVRRVLDHIAATLSTSNQAPLAWTVISPLARGADRIVAEAVLERPGARLQVVTPLPIDEYRRDFATPEDLAEFQALLARASSVHELAPRARVSDATADDDRNHAYFRAGECVVDGCEILICVWNGQPAAGTGGTADVVKYARQRGRMVVWVDSNHPEAGPGTLPATAKALSPGYHQQAAFLADQAIDASTLVDAVGHDASALNAASAAAKLPVTALDAVTSSLLPVFVRADRLAIHYQQRYVLATNAILYLAASAVTIAAAQILFFPEQPRLVLLEVMSMLAVFGVWWHSRRERWHEKWLHDRFLAEQLRGAMFLTLLGAAGERTHEDRLPFYPGPHQWLDSAVRNLQHAAAAQARDTSLEPLRTFLSAAWLNHQQAFHADNARRKTWRAEKRHRLGGALFGATLLMALLHFLGVGHANDPGVPSVLIAGSWITFFALAFPAWAAAVHAITAQLELERIAARSSRMAVMLEELSRRAGQSRSMTDLRDVSLEAAALMAAETREWWALLSFQDLKLHA